MKNIRKIWSILFVLLLLAPATQAQEIKLGVAWNDTSAMANRVAQDMAKIVK